MELNEIKIGNPIYSYPDCSVFFPMEFYNKCYYGFMFLNGMFYDVEGVSYHTANQFKSVTQKYQYGYGNISLIERRAVIAIFEYGFH